MKSNLNQKGKNNAVGYIRVSTKEQKKEGNSLLSQKKSIHEYIQNNRLKLIDIYEESESASKVYRNDFDISPQNLSKALTNRRELKKLVESAQKREFSHLIVYSRDRLVRNFELFIALNYFFKKYNITIHYTKPGENLEDNNINKFIELVLGSVAELESNLISIRVKSGLEEKVKQGYWPAGKPPYGYNLSYDKDTDVNILEQFHPKLNNVKEIFKLYNSGYSYRVIASKMNSFNNTSNWTKSKIECIIKNPLYMGKLVYNRRCRNKEVDSELIECSDIQCNQNDLNTVKEQNWIQANNLRSKKSTKDKKYFNTPFLLKGKLICGNCNNKLKPKNYGKDRNGKQRDKIYRCNQCSLIIKKNNIENIFQEKFLSIINIDNIDEIWNKYSLKVNKELNDNEITLKEESNSRDKKLRTVDKIDDLLNKSISEDMKEALITEKTKLIQEIKEHKNKIKLISDLKPKYFTNKSHLKKSIQKFFSEDFKNLNNARKRVIVDTLIDKIIVNNKNISSIEILLNTTIDSL